MKCLMRKIDMFCYRHPNFGISNLILYVMGGNILVWLLTMMDTSGLLLFTLAFDAQAIFLRGEVWRLITFIFLPYGNSVASMIFQMYCYYFFAKTLETAWGKGKLTIFYFSGMLLHILFGTCIWLFGNPIAMLSMFMTAFYLNFSLFLVFATLYPDTTIMLFLVIPLKARWLAIAELLYFLYIMLTGILPFNLLPLVAILNYLLFCGAWIPHFIGIKSVPLRKRTREFKTAANKINFQQRAQGYTRKCEVCGRTDTKYPDLEFRFCSKCNGFHCFCIEHINNHVHFEK